jgi:GNAT superfamily N-acetyltransferase
VPVDDFLRQLVRQVDAHAHAIALLSTAEERIGPFSLLLHPEPGMSAVTLAPGAPADPGDLRPALTEIRARFAARGERARIELSLLAWPPVPVALEDAGFRLAEQAPLLVATPDWLVPHRPDAVSLTEVTPKSDAPFVAAVMRQGFEVRGQASPEEEGAAVRRSLAAGMDLVVARLGDAPAGSGCLSPRAGVAEISAVSTLPSCRRRGVAAAVVSWLAARHVACGGTLLWASAPTTPAFALASHCGFRDAGVRLAYLDAAE